LLIQIVTATGKMNKSEINKTSSQQLFSIPIYVVEIDYLLASDPLTVRRAAEGDAHCLRPVGRARLRVALAPPTPCAASRAAPLMTLDGARPREAAWHAPSLTVAHRRKLPPFS